MFLPHLPAMKTWWKEPLVDYSQSHIVTSNEYLQILYNKAMDKETTKIIRKERKMEREKTKWRHVANSCTTTNKAGEKLVEKQYKENFNWAWFIMAIKEAWDKFHQNF